MNPCICPFCTAPRPDGDGSMCLAYEETYESVLRGGGRPEMWINRICAEWGFEDAVEESSGVEVTK